MVTNKEIAGNVLALSPFHVNVYFTSDNVTAFLRGAADYVGENLENRFLLWRFCFGSL
jgi:hypothetical protein